MTPVPVPTSERWKPLRAGLVDMFYYDAEEFRFHDGRLLLREIDDDIWQGQPVDPEAEVRIYGEIDIDSRTSSIDVETTSIDVERLTHVQDNQQNAP